MNYNVIAADGTVYGPIDEVGLRRWAAEGRVTQATLIEEVGTGRRFMANSVPGLFAPPQGFAPPPQASYTAQSPGPVAQTQYPRVGYTEPINNHLVKAIITTFCCCTPLGIAAIVFASQVAGKQMAGDYYGAKECARKADLYGNVAIGLGLAFGVMRLASLFLLHGR